MEAGLHERTTGAVFEAALGFRLRNRQYRTIVAQAGGDEVSALTATRDLQAMTAAGLLEAKGARRGSYYVPTAVTTALREAARVDRPPLRKLDPFEAVS